MDVTLSTARLRLVPGESETIEVRVASHAASPIRGEVQLLSPAGSWTSVPCWTAGFTADAGQTAAVGFRLAVPADARPGQSWWVLAKVMYFGRARYSEAAEIVIGGPRGGRLNDI